MQILNLLSIIHEILKTVEEKTRLLAKYFKSKEENNNEPNL